MGCGSKRRIFSYLFPCRVLLTKTEGLDDSTVALDVVILQVVQKGATLGNQLRQSTGGTIIFTVHLQVLRQVGNTV